MPDRVEIPLVEPCVVLDTFATELAMIETMPGGNFRFIFACEHMACDGTRERIVVAKIITHESLVGRAVAKTIRKMGGEAMRPVLSFGIGAAH